MLEEEVFRLLDNNLDSMQRSKALDALRDSVRQQNGRLMIGDLPGLFSRFKQSLGDSSNSVIYGVLQLLIEIVPEYGQPDIDAQVAGLLPQLIMVRCRNLSRTQWICLSRLDSLVWVIPWGRSSLLTRSGITDRLMRWHSWVSGERDFLST